VINHDAMFKSLLKTGRLLRDFFAAFLPDVHAFIDFDHTAFLDKERFTMQGKRRTGDLLIKTRFRGEDAAFLIHMEHEAQARPDLALRMLEYLLLDWRDFDLPVYPVAVLSHPEFNPQTKSPLNLWIRNQEILKFHFAIIDLARLGAMEHVRKLNAAAMALSTRMRLAPEERVALAVDFIRNTTRVQWKGRELDAISRFFFAYQPFSREEDLKLDREISRMKDMEIPKEVLRRNPIFRSGMNEGLNKGVRRGIRRGVHQGRQQEGAELVLRLLARRVGSVIPSQEVAIRKLPLSDIESLGEALLDFVSAADLAAWLKSRSR
jgi:hypothetical protein